MSWKEFQIYYSFNLNFVTLINLLVWIYSEDKLFLYLRWFDFKTLTFEQCFSICFHLCILFSVMVVESLIHYQLDLNKHQLQINLSHYVVITSVFKLHILQKKVIPSFVCHGIIRITSSFDWFESNQKYHSNGFYFSLSRDFYRLYWLNYDWVSGPLIFLSKLFFWMSDWEYFQNFLIFYWKHIQHFHSDQMTLYFNEDLFYMWLFN